MNFKLTNIDAINQMYGKKMAKMNETTWHGKVPIVVDAVAIAVQTGCAVKTVLLLK